MGPGSYEQRVGGATVVLGMVSTATNTQATLQGQGSDAKVGPGAYEQRVGGATVVFGMLSTATAVSKQKSLQTKGEKAAAVE